MSLERLELRRRRRSRRGAVRVAEPLAIRAQRFRAVFVLGLGEGEFPARGAGEPFLPDALRRELARDLGLRLPLREDVLARERYLLYACVSRATEQVTLSYCSSDEEGNLALPSPFLAGCGRAVRIRVGRAPAHAAARRRRLAPVRRRPHRGSWCGPGPPAAEASAAAPTRRQLTAAALDHVRHTEVVSAAGARALRRVSGPVAGGEPARARSGSARSRSRSCAGAICTPSSSRSSSGLGEAAHRALPAAGARAARGGDGARAGGGGQRRPRGGGCGGGARRPRAGLRRYLQAEAADGCDWTPVHIELRFGIGGDEDELPALRARCGCRRR